MLSVKNNLEEYLKINAVNWSTLKEMNRSPLHYAHRVATPREDTSSLARGRAVHTAFLEPEMFKHDYVVFSGKRRQGKEWDEFEAAYGENYTILKQDEYDKAWNAAKALRKHPEAAALLRDCKTEQAFMWKDKQTGLKCKCRIDGLGGVLFDLKSTSNVDARLFGNLAARMLYHGQIGMYCDAVKFTGDAYIIAVEAEPPHDVAVFQFGEDELQVGRELYQGLLMRVAECKNTGKWPGKYPERERLVLPKYVYGEDEEGGSYEVLEVSA